MASLASSLVSLHSPFVFVNNSQVITHSYSTCPTISNLNARIAWIQALHGPNVQLSFHIERDRNGLDRTYCAYFKREDGSREVLLWAKKWRKSTADQYVISVNPEDLDVARPLRSAGYIGKLKALQSKRVYVLFDNGDKNEGTLNELGCIIFSHERAPAGTIYEPKMEVAVPSATRPATAGGEWRVGIVSGGCGALRSTMNTARQRGLENSTQVDEATMLREIPEFKSNNESGPQFKSVKNFSLQLTLPSSHAERAQVVATAGGKDAADAAQQITLLHMEKTGEETFTVSFSQPFSLLQAFGIAISRFDTRQTD